jgi:hypothetical protein
MSKRFDTFLAIVGLLCISVPLTAHHGNAAYNEAKLVTVKATVTEWIWANPHCSLRFDVKDDSGNVVHWAAETSNPPDMVGHGWSKNTLKPGDEITIVMLTVKNGRPIGRVRQVTLPDGKILTNESGLTNRSLNSPAPPLSEDPKP